MTSLHRRRFGVLAAFATLALVAGDTGALLAQDGPNWQRRQAPTQVRTAPFPATMAVNLPTTETLEAGEFLFEVAHRFNGVIESGSDNFWGLDGGAQMRLALAWAPVDRVMVSLSRSNLDDNLDFGIRGRLFTREGGIPFAVGVAGGIARNTEVPEGTETQLHAAAVVDLALTDRLSLGIVPGIVTNPNVRDPDDENAVFLGGHARLELTDGFSLIGEWVGANDESGADHGSGAFGIELETGGHFFKIVAGNSIRLNPSQAFVGADDPFEAGQLRIGFNIVRLISF